jgi:anaerobic magnesium-protoporphyrin IX monomethyl ester cyclase
MLALILATKDIPGYNYFKPLGLGYLKSYIKRELPTVEIQIFDNIDSLIQAKPDCVGISAATEDFSIAQRYVMRVQQQLNCPVLMGGVHISLLPETLPKGVIACIGEGEETLIDLMKIFLLHHKFDQASLLQVKSIAFWDDRNNLIQTELRELMTPLDNIPLPDRDSLGIKPGKNETLYMFTSRGCPYRCKFCVSRVHWKKYREFSADYVIKEMEELVKKYKVKNISFFDDLFIVNRVRLKDIANKFKEKHFRVQTVCAVRANLVDDELCELLNKLNVKEVSFGAESFSEPVLRELKKGSVTVAQNQHALDILQKHGIKANVSIIFDAPEEKKEDLIATWRALFNNLRTKKLNKVGWGLLRPYPGCDYWDLAVQKGIVGVNMDWDNFKNWNGFHLNDNMTRSEVNKIIEEWETKCYLVNLHFRDEAQPLYLNEETIFIRKENLLKEIVARGNKDESDNFVIQKYNHFLQTVEQFEIVPVSGWYENEKNESWRWISKEATFCIPIKIKDVANLLNLMFYIPKIENYEGHELHVTFKVGHNQKSVRILREGEYAISIEIPPSVGNLGRFFDCEIINSSSFCPASISSSTDDRNLSIVVNRLELANDDPLNVIRSIRLRRNE